MRQAPKYGTIICQRCIAANTIGDEFCSRCGTRLMLVVEPAAGRYEEQSAVADYEEHLLERVSTLENQLLRVVERLTQGMELLSRQARATYIDHTLFETLLEVLNETGMVNRRAVEKRWREHFERDAAEAEQGNRRAALKEKIKEAHTEGPREEFDRLVREGFSLVEKGKTAQGIRTLERASALAPANGPLNTFLGEHFFREGKMTLARDYLSRALTAEPENQRVCLLLGLVCGEEGDAARAKGLLSKAVSGGRLSFAAHYALGRLHAAEEDWASALAEFKHALAARKCPEAHYFIGLVYYQTGRYRLALRHAQSALKLDEDYADAHYLLGLVRLQLGEGRLAAESFASAGLVNEKAGRKSVRGGKGNILRVEDLPQPKFLTQTRRKGRRRLLTGGDSRLAAALREDALGDSVTR